MKLLQFTFSTSHFTINFHLSFVKLFIGNLLKIEKCKLIINSEGVL